MNCKAIFLSSPYYLDPIAEKERYEEHNNDVTDLRYQEFVRPVVEKILVEHTPSARGLDYGCGTGPVITSLLAKKGFTTQLYDPYFQPDTRVLSEEYDYVICCEVMEHFQAPVKEFRKLKDLLSKTGSIYCKTSLFDKNIDFKKWYYKDDPTHVTFYTKKGLKHLQKKVGFSRVEFFEKLIVLRK